MVDFRRLINTNTQKSHKIMENSSKHHENMNIKDIA